MFLNVLAYELRYRFRLVSTWVYIILAFIVAFLIANLAGGAFDGFEIQAGKSGEFTYVNNPLNISTYILMLMYLCTIIFAAIFGSSSVRDFETGSYELFFTKPVSPRMYFLGRFSGSYLSALAVVISIVLGFAIGFRMPYLSAYKIGPQLPLAYLHVLCYFAIPNLFVMGVLFFGVGILTRKVINSYVAGICVFFAYILAGMLAGDVEKLTLAALLDPLGMSTIAAVTRYWTSAKSNSSYLSLQSLIGWNRLIWLSMGSALLIYCLHKFQFVSRLLSGKAKARKESKSIPPQIVPGYIGEVNSKPYSSWRQFCYLVGYEFKNIVFNRSFLVIISGFALFLIITATQMVGKIYGTQTYPLTSQVLAALGGNFILFGLIISTFYAGDLLWRDRNLNLHQLYDSSPHHSFVSYFSKLGAIIMMQWMLLGTILLVGVVVQITKGYFRFEFAQYFFELFVVYFIELVPVTLMLFFFAIVMNNRYTGYIAMIVFYAALISLGALKIDHPLLTFNSGGVSYSEMNGYGSFIPRFLIRKAYWLLFCIGFSFVGFKFWNRGTEIDFRAKLKRIRSNGFDKGWKLATGTFIAFLLLGGYLYYNMNILNEYISPRRWKKMQVQYEKQYRTRLSALPQPRISDVSLKIDIFPKTRKMDIAGSYWLVNKTTAPIDSLVMSYDDEYIDQKLEFGKTAKLVHRDDLFDVFIYRLATPLAPHDSIKLDFAFRHQPKGIPSEGSGSKVMNNGTFFDNSMMPSFGYKDGYELQDNNERKKKGLAPKPRMAAITDSTQYRNSYVSTDSDYVRYHVDISTDADQIAFAPGDLLNSYTKDGRYHAEYGSSVPILNFLSFVSGRYEKVTDKYQDKLVEVYYDRKHPYNVQSMLASAKNTLRYCSENFMPYPHKALRIVEVPYVYFAQSFPALIPFSENVGFIAKVDPNDNSAVDYPYQVTAHEVGHQWWAHTVIGANVQGATMFSECFTEYTSMMLIKEKYGVERMRRYLRYTHDNYLSGRSGEYKEEQPLYLNENQAYLNYNKGTLVMFALQDYLGEKAVNAALGAFCKDFAYHSDPFPISTDVLPYLRQVAPDNRKYLINDLLESIILYDNRVIDAKQSFDTNRKVYQTTITFSTAKAKYDGLGNKSPVKVADVLDIAIYDDTEEKRLATKTVEVNGTTQSVTIESKVKPGKVILDPYFKQIDSERKNNSKSLG